MNLTEQPPSSHWASLSFRGETIAQVWFKPEGAPFGLTFRISQRIFQHSDISPLLTIENLLKAVGLAADDVESWVHSDGSPSTIAGYQSELRSPLPPPPQEFTQLYIHVTMRPQEETSGPSETGESRGISSNRQSIQTRWNTILAMEVTIDTLRQRMESLRGEIEAATGKSLSSDEKLHALNNDVAQWNKAKSRARHVLPRVKEFIHRAIWAMGTPERKKLEEFFKLHVDIPDSHAQLDHDLQILLKDRQILSAQGVSGYQEGKNSCDDIQRAFRALQSNAASNAVKKRAATRAKNK